MCFLRLDRFSTLNDQRDLNMSSIQCEREEKRNPDVAQDTVPYSPTPPLNSRSPLFLSLRLTDI